MPAHKGGARPSNVRARLVKLRTQLARCQPIAAYAASRHATSPSSKARSSRSSGGCATKLARSRGLPAWAKSHRLLAAAVGGGATLAITCVAMLPFVLSHDEEVLLPEEQLELAFAAFDAGDRDDRRGAAPSNCATPNRCTSTR